MGLAIIDRSADYSDLNIGKKTFVKDPTAEAELIATAYCTAIDSNKHKEAIKSMVLSLLEANLWDKFVCIYPFLGNNIDALKTNLVIPNTFNAEFGNNISIGDNSIIGSKTIAAGIHSAEMIDLSNEITSVFDFLSFSNTNSTPFGYRTRSVDTYSAYLQLSYMSAYGAENNNRSLVSVFDTAKVDLLKTQEMSYNTMNKVVGLVNTCSVKDKRLKTSMNGAVIGESTCSATMLVVNNIIGYNYITIPDTTSTGVKELFDGTLYMHAIGKMDENDANIAYNIIKEFVNNIKELDL